MINWWWEQTPWLRYGIAILFLAISTGLFFLADRIWPWGWAIGVVLLMLAGPSIREKRGYRR